MLPVPPLPPSAPLLPAYAMHYRPEVDGLRALALLPVMLFHAGLETFGGGFVGVDVFFVISGYLITSIILADLHAGQFSLRHFYERRARRILPALLVMLLLCSLVAWRWLLPDDMVLFTDSLLATVAFGSNIHFWQTAGYFDVAGELKPLLHSWSLAVEEQFYLLFPLFVLLVWRYAKAYLIAALVLLAVLSFAVAQWGALNRPSAAFYLLPTRGWELLLGSFVALYLRSKGHGPTSRKPPRWLLEAGAAGGLVMIIHAVLQYDRSTDYPGAYALVPTLGACLVLLCAQPGTWAARLLSDKALVGIGLISYSTYLWHQPLFAFARLIGLNHPSLPLMAALGLASFVLGALSWRFVERPFRHLGTVSLRAAGAALVLVVGALLAFGVGSNRTQGYPQRLDAQVLQLLAGSSDRNPRREQCHAGEINEISPKTACVLGKPTSVTGALLGDSHADALASALHSGLQGQGLAFKHLSYSSCPPLLNVYSATHGPMHACAAYNRAVFDYLTADAQITHVVMTARWTIYLEKTGFDNGEGGAELERPAYIDVLTDGKKLPHSNALRLSLIKQQYRETVWAYLRAGKKVILVYPVPEVGWDVPRRLAKAHLQSGDQKRPVLSTNYARFVQRNRVAYDALDAIGEHPNLVRIKPERLLCNSDIAGRCVAERGGVPLYYDDDHLSTTGARPLVAEMMPHLLR